MDSDRNLQPLAVVSSNAAAIISLQSHLVQKEVRGVLAGTKTHSNIYIKQALPILYLPSSRTDFVQQLMQEVHTQGLEVLGVYHSHPYDPPNPTEQDLIVHALQQRTYSFLSISGIFSVYSKEVGIAGQLNLFVLDSNERVFSQLGYYPYYALQKVTKKESLDQVTLERVKDLVKNMNSKSQKINLNETWKNNLTYKDKIKAALTEIVSEPHQISYVVDLLDHEFLNNIV